MQQNEDVSTPATGEAQEKVGYLPEVTQWRGDERDFLKEEVE